jgi:Rrf2 family transcriptional regulator, cysteine metabolism repressor
MEVSARTMYGLRALVTLAGARTREPMSIQAIAEEESLPGKFLEGIMGDLKRGGFVRSRRGAAGGYVLARPASEITVLDIIRHLDGPIAPQTYAAQAEDGEATPRQAAFNPLWCEIRESTIRALQSCSIQAIADSVQEQPRDNFTPNYQI